MPSVGTRSYSSYIDSASGRRAHNIGGGGGRFCGGVIIQNTILNLGPGVYYFNRDVLIDNAIINAAGSGTVTLASTTMLPAAGGQQTNGVTFIRGGRSFGVLNGSGITSVPRPWPLRRRRFRGASGRDSALLVRAGEQCPLRVERSVLPSAFDGPDPSSALA